MSYILEALKRSQAERELGRVPTLESANLLPEDRAEPTANPWPLVSVGLAAMAVLIALYAALRVPGGPITADPATRLASTLASAEPERVADPAADGRASPPPAILAPPTAVPPAVATTLPAMALPSGSGASGPGGLTTVSPLAVVPPAAPLVEPPPPKGLARVSPPASPETDPEEPGFGTPSPDSAALGDLDDLQLEQELQRQLEADETMAAEVDQLAEERSQDPPTPVPPDLIAAIDAFKHQVQGGPDRAQGKAKGKSDAELPPVAVAPAPVMAPPYAGDPTQLRLTREQQADLPAFLMSVHVYDENPTKRFVLIDGLKYGEGDHTRKGIMVEEIRSDGAVLSHQGRPFFLHR